jgi:hypothetical protein
MPRARFLRFRRLATLAVSAALAASASLAAGSGGAAVAATPTATNDCRLGPTGAVRHVVYVQFDNTHFLRDRPNVPSDLEQMPHLLDFMKSNGTLLTNDHTILISHTAGGILSSLTGVYPDRHGQTVSNSYVRTSATGSFSFPSSFGYWTDPVSGTVPNMVTPTGANAPAPWVPFTRAGCDFGAVATANTVLENNGAVFVQGGPTPLTADAAIGDTTILVGSITGFTGGLAITIGTGADAEAAHVLSSTNLPSPRLVLTTGLTKAHAAGSKVLGTTSTNPNGDLTKVFGEGSPEWLEGKASQTSLAGTAERALAQTDFVGLSIHCAQDSPICASGRDDVLPAEPDGYDGFKALHGAKHINPLLTTDPWVTGLDGSHVVDPFNQPGFPGFDGMSGAASLAYTAEMQEAGVPITFAYISDAHDNHGNAGNIHTAYGPGSAGYVAQLKAYDDAFAAFFSRLAADGIDKSNTMFVFTVDEGDHFSGSEPANPGCDGVTTACDWDTPENGHARVGEINGNIALLVASEFPALAAKFQGTAAPNAFTVHGDDAPTFYLAKKGVGQLAQTDPDNREFERTIATLRAVNPYTNATDHLMVAMADQAEMKLLHMFTTGDPNRNASFTFFADPNYFLTDFPPSTCFTCINSDFAWNHGDIQPEIAATWLGFVGPGVRVNGVDGATWTDHVDVRPTLLSALGLRDHYQDDGRVILEVLDGSVVARGINAHRGGLQKLGAAFKQLDAPFGSFGMDSLAYATPRITSGSADDDTTYHSLQIKLADWGARRDDIARRINDLLDGLAFGGASTDRHTIDSLTAEAKALIAEVHAARP